MSKPTTQELYAALLAKRQGAQKFAPGEIRLSEVGGCQRKASLRILGYSAETAGLQQESVFLSGDEHEEHIADLWRSRYPRRVLRQVRVPSPFGVGHMDIWVAPIRHYVESKSILAKHRKDLPRQEHVDQVLMYQHFWINAHGGTAEVAYRLKETGEILSFPVRYDSERAALLVRRLEALQEARETGMPIPLPEDAYPDRYPCGYLRDGRLQPCPFWHTCWGIQGVTDEPAAVAILARYREAEGRVRAAKAVTSDAEEEREGVRAAAELVMERLGTSVIHHDGFEVRRSSTGRWYPKEIAQKGA